MTEQPVATGFEEAPAWLAAEREESGASAPEAPAAVESSAEVTALSEEAFAEPETSVEPVSVEPVSVGSAAVGSSEAAAVSEGAVSEAAVSEGGAVAVKAAGDKPVSKATIADIEEAMKDVVDPELGINVVDLGLVYDTFVDDDNVVTLDMTLTSAACPLTDVIEDQTRQALCGGPGGGLASDFRINWVWLPPWGPDKITDDGRDQLRALGFNV